MSDPVTIEIDVGNIGGTPKAVHALDAYLLAVRDGLAAAFDLAESEITEIKAAAARDAKAREEAGKPARGYPLTVTIKLLPDGGLVSSQARLAYGGRRTVESAWTGVPRPGAAGDCREGVGAPGTPPASIPRATAPGRGVEA